MNPLVSVVIPVYNDVLVGEAIESILKQTYKPIEIIVIDDGSNTNIAKLLKNYSKFITYVRTENCGAAAARNRGIKCAKGRYIAFLDSDDIFLPDKIKLQVDFMVKNEAVFCYTGYVRKRVGEDRVISSVDYINSEVSFPDIISECLIATPTVMIDKNILQHHRLFDESMYVGEDVCAWIDIAYKYKMYCIHDLLTVVRVDDNTAAYNIKKYRCGLKNILRYVKDKYSNFSNEIDKLSTEANKINVLFINEFWLTGGVERVISNLANNFACFCDVHIYIYKSHYDCVYELSSKVNIVHCNVGNDDLNALAIIKYIREHNIDIVVGNSGIAISALHIYHELVKNNIKFIVCNHESYFYPCSVKELHNSIIERIHTLRFADVVTFPTPYSAQAYNCFCNNALAMPNLLDYDVDVNHKKSLSEKRHVLLAVGRFDDRNKHLDRILEVYALVRKALKCELYVVGDVIFDRKIDINANETVEAQMRRLKLDRNDVHFAGKTSDVKKYYAMADVFLLTSETEAFAMVLAEAGSFGVPSVIMSIPGLDNYVIRDGINGFICAQGAYQDMADKVCLLLCDDNLYESMSTEAVLLANRFSKTVVVDRWKKILACVHENNKAELRRIISGQSVDTIALKDFVSVCQEYQNTINILVADRGNKQFHTKSIFSILDKTYISYKEFGVVYTIKKIIHKLWRSI